MATLAPVRSAMTGEHRFFLVSALAMAAVIVGGFSLSLAMGRSSFALPPIYHIHGVVFFGWITLYVLQNALVTTGSVRLHRRLGWAALAWIPAMVPLAIAMTVTAMRDHGGPPFFAAPSFLIGNPAAILYFAVVSAAAILLRRRTAWHRRLMFCGTAALTGPGFGRLLPTPFMIPWSWWVVALAMPALFPLAGIVADLRRGGRVHPAWWWGLGGFVTTFLAAELLAASPWGVALTRAVLAGSPGAARDFAAHFP